MHANIIGSQEFIAFVVDYDSHRILLQNIIINYLEIKTKGKLSFDNNSTFVICVKPYEQLLLSYLISDHKNNKKRKRKMNVWQKTKYAKKRRNQRKKQHSKTMIKSDINVDGKNKEMNNKSDINKEILSNKSDIIANVKKQYICEELQFIQTFADKKFKQKYHYLNSTQDFFHCISVRVLNEICSSIDSHHFLSFNLNAWMTTELMDGQKSFEIVSDFGVSVQCPPIFLACNYNKFSREISQTPFAYAKYSVQSLIIQQMRKFQNESECENSNNSQSDIAVEIKEEMKEENIVCNAKKYKNIVNENADKYGFIDQTFGIKQNVFACNDIIMSGGGREDMDVRMLGNGRPMLLRLIQPRKCKKSFTVQILKEFEIFCNKNCLSKIAINDLRLSNADYNQWMKACEQSKRKTYRCYCWSSTAFSAVQLKKIFADIINKYKISENNPLIVKQWTPIRVLSRRSLIERERSIFKFCLFDCCESMPHWMIVDINAQAGTYIKEFCHGDRGRTQPNLATLLNCDVVQIVALDVMEICIGNIPPQNK